MEDLLSHPHKIAAHRDMYAMSVEDCKGQFSTSIGFAPDDSFICTYSHTQTVGTTVPGGPLVSNNSLIGVSLLRVDDGYFYPDVFTNVFPQLEWIVSILYG